MRCPEPPIDPPHFWEPDDESGICIGCNAEMDEPIEDMYICEECWNEGVRC